MHYFFVNNFPEFLYIDQVEISRFHLVDGGVELQQHLLLLSLLTISNNTLNGQEIMSETETRALFLTQCAK